MKQIKFATPDITAQEIREVNDVIKSGWLTAGPVVHKFERRIARFSGASRAVAFDSCTGAMEMTLRVLGIGPGDEVITTPYTYSATAEVIRNVGAEIKFVDLDGVSFEMDYDKVAAAITEHTKAVMPVDIGGKMCDYRALLAAVTSKKDIFIPANDLQEAIGRVAIVADAAHSFGAESDGWRSGQAADFTCFSFHVLKCITTGGEGGAVVWRDFDGIDNSVIETNFRLLGDHGQTSRDKKKGWEYDIKLFGYNSIMTNIDAAMGLAQLDRWDEIVERRATVTARYDTLLYWSNKVVPLIKHSDSYLDRNLNIVCSQSSMHLYPVRILTGTKSGKKSEMIRNEVYRLLKKAGIPCNVHYKPLPMMTAYKEIGFDIKGFPNAYTMFASLLTLPYHTELTEKEQKYIVRELDKAVNSVC